MFTYFLLFGHYYFLTLLLLELFYSFSSCLDFFLAVCFSPFGDSDDVVV